MTSIYSPAGGYYFNRQYEVAITAPGSTTAVAFGTIIDGIVRNGQPAPLKVAFQIERDLTSTANKSSISLYNLQQQTRQSLGLNSQIQVKAGYTGLVGVIYTGFCKRIVSARSGPDIVTTMECGDGEPYITYATIDKSYASAVKLSQCIEDIAAAMSVDFNGVTFAVKPGVVRGLPNKTYTRGMHLHGSCRSQLDKLLHPLKLEWSVQNGQLFILPHGAASTVVAQVLSAKTGLVGLPSKNDNYFSFQSLLNPHLRPGGLVILDSKNTELSGTYKLRKVTYSGDSHGGDWVCECEADLLTNPTQVYSTAQGQDLSKAVTP